MIDKSREKIKFAPEKPMREAMQHKRKHAGIEQDFPTAARRGSRALIESR